jgi:hypothetical protein
VFGNKLEKNQNAIQVEIREDRSQGILAIIRCRIFCLPLCYPKIRGFTELSVCLLFCKVVKSGRSH